MEEKKTKPGWKTTEFWLSMVAFIVGALLASGAISNDVMLQVLGGAAVVLNALGYSVSRSLVKSGEAKANAQASLVDLMKKSNPSDPS